MSAPITINLLREDDMQVDYHISGRDDALALVVTFTERSHRDIGGVGFGTTMLLQHGCDVLAIKTNRNLWYENLSAERLKRVSRFVRKIKPSYPHCVTYGSSMGAYAAIRFAKAFGADRVLAISPLFDIKQDWDTRWKRDWPQMSTQAMMRAQDIVPSTDYFIIYDPYCPDARHAEQFAQVIAPEKLFLLRTPFSGHPSGGYLRDIGIISRLTMSVVNQGVYPADFVQQKKNKRYSKSYLFWLAEACLQRRKLRTARSLTEHLLTLEPGQAEYHMQLGRILHLAKDLRGAIAAADRAAQLNLANPHYGLYRDMLLKKLPSPV